jgi:hypothetical protein
MKGQADYRLRLPKPTPSAMFGQHRVRNTNKVLTEFGFDSDQRDELFRAYGRDSIIEALALYTGAEVNVNYSDVRAALADGTSPTEVQSALQSGLVATLESLRTIGTDRTENVIYGGGNIVDVMAEKYRTRSPAMRARTDEQKFQIALIQYLVETHITQENQ